MDSWNLEAYEKNISVQWYLQWEKASINRQGKKNKQVVFTVSLEICFALSPECIDTSIFPASKWNYSSWTVNTEWSWSVFSEGTVLLSVFVVWIQDALPNMYLWQVWELAFRSCNIQEQSVRILLTIPSIKSAKENTAWELHVSSSLKY